MGIATRIPAGPAAGSQPAKAVRLGSLDLGTSAARVKASPRCHAHTSSDDSEDIDQAYDAGTNSYLVKPVKFASLLDLVRILDLYWIFLNEKPKLHR